MTEPTNLFTILNGCNSAEGIDILRKSIDDSGLDINALVDEEMSLLSTAVAMGNAKLVSLLLDYGAEPNRWDQSGSPLGIAAGNGNVEICKILFAAGADPNLSPIAGSNVPIARASGLPAKLPALKWLLSMNADVNLTCISLKGNVSGTALSRAAGNGNIEAVRLLLAKGADPNIVFASGTALSLAVEEGEFEIATLLLNAGANRSVVAPISSGFPLANKTPLEIAQIKKRHALIKLLSDDHMKEAKPDSEGVKKELMKYVTSKRWRLAAGASESELLEAEEKLGLLIPSLLRDLLTVHNGEFDESDGMFPAPSGDQLDESYLLLSTYLMPIARENVSNSIGVNEATGLVPFASDGGGDFLCVDTTTGRVMQIRNELCAKRLVSDSLEAWVDTFVK